MVLTGLILPLSKILEITMCYVSLIVAVTTRKQDNGIYSISIPGGYSDIDKYKLERKRERNRIAATKCR